MGRAIKNLELTSRSYAIRLPMGDNDIAPQFPVTGQTRFNTVSNTMEVYYSSAWHGVGLEGRVRIDKDSFIADGIKSTWSMVNSYLAGEEAYIIVFIGGVFQDPGTSYTVNGYDITFSSIPDASLPIVLLHNFNSTRVGG